MICRRKNVQWSLPIVSSLGNSMSKCRILRLPQCCKHCASKGPDPPSCWKLACHGRKSNLKQQDLQKQMSSKGNCRWRDRNPHCSCIRNGVDTADGWTALSSFLKFSNSRSAASIKQMESSPISFRGEVAGASMWCSSKDLQLAVLMVFRADRQCFSCKERRYLSRQFCRS